jgi:DNA-binding transcriptional ArsR family regulator
MRRGKILIAATLGGYAALPQFLRRREDQFVGIRLQIPDSPNGLVHVGPAPLAEAVLSLHVLLHPKEHPLQHPWIREMRTLSAGLKREIRSFGFLYSDITADFMLPERADAPQTFDEALAAFAAMPPERARYELTRPAFFYMEESGGPESLERDDVLERIHERVGDPELVQQLLDDPAVAQSRVVDMLAQYWEQSFAEEWERLEPILEEEVERASGHDPIELLGEVRAEHMVDVEKRLIVRRSMHHHEVAVEPANPLRLIPSVYVWPHVRVNCDAPWPLAVLYPPATMRNGLRGTRPPEPLVQTLRAAADPTRLRILQLVGEQPRSTEELAPLVGLSESGLSKHLRALTDAGLLTTKRQGWYVLYHLDRERLALLGDELVTYVS